MHKIKIVSTCVNYSDYLEHTLPHNLSISTNITIITEKNDIETKNICKQNNTKYIEMDGLGQQNKAFDWAGAYNKFLNLNFSLNSWILIIDADIFIPKIFKTFIKNNINNLDNNTLYCTTRSYLPMDYTKIFENISLAKRLDRYDDLGWSILEPCCWGYFMFFYNNGNRLWINNDIAFAESFEKTFFLPREFSVAHIPHGTWEDWGKNFYGRKTENLNSFRP